MTTVSAKIMDPLIREIVWRFGAQGIKGECCGDLTAPEFRALRLASAQDKCSMQHIAQGLGFTKSGATRVVDRLALVGGPRPSIIGPALQRRTPWLRVVLRWSALLRFAGRIFGTRLARLLVLAGAALNVLRLFLGRLVFCRVRL